MTPDLLRQGRLTVVLWSSALHTAWMCAGQDRDLPRSMDKAFEGRRPGKADLAENVATGATEPLSKGELWFPINSILLALTFSFPGTYILLTSCVLGSLFVTELRSLPGSKHLTVPLSPLLIGICHSFREARPWFPPHGY